MAAKRFQDGWNRISRDLSQYKDRATGSVNVPRDRSRSKDDESEYDDYYTVADIPYLCNEFGIDYELEFGRHAVTPLDDHPDNYGQGPSSSTRLTAHQFVPDKEELLRNLIQVKRGILSTQFIDNLEGDVYVEWRKGSTWSKYVGVPLSAYREFRTSSSKGTYFKRGRHGPSGAWDGYHAGYSGPPPE